MEIRCNRKSTVFCSQYSFDGWHQLLDGGPIADAILDRIIKVLIRLLYMENHYVKNIQN